ncbi:MAG TPA: MlaD family protein [Tepidisphaeraceae bacterium]|nr:MlaD family protein [Tepidisphaeraceae bacterium]
MSPYRRNILVGAVVLGALIFLGWMILRFGDQPAKLFADPTMPIYFTAQRADGVAEGSPVLYQGVNVGRVTRVKRSEDGKGVRIEAQVDVAPPLPANVHGVIIAQSLLGAGAVISLQLTEPEPTGKLAAGATLNARYVGLEMIPPEFASLATELRLSAAQFRESRIIEHLDQQVQKAGEVMDSVKSLLDDQQMRADLKTSLANVRSATEQANRIGTNLEKFSTELEKIGKDASSTVGQAKATLTKADEQITDLTRQVGQRLTQVAKLLDTFQSISNKLDNGQGTAGQFVNDPKLYESLVATSRELNAMVSDLKRLVEQWEQEGISVKLPR